MPTGKRRFAINSYGSEPSWRWILIPAGLSVLELVRQSGLDRLSVPMESEQNKNQGIYHENWRNTMDFKWIYIGFGNDIKIDVPTSIFALSCHLMREPKRKKQEF